MRDARPSRSVLGLLRTANARSKARDEIIVKARDAANPSKLLIMRLLPGCWRPRAIIVFSAGCSPARRRFAYACHGEKIAVILDTETTGLDHTRDEVIELGMVAFVYDEEGRIGNVIGTFNGLREPGVPISPEITRQPASRPIWSPAKCSTLRRLSGSSHRQISSSRTMRASTAPSVSACRRGFRTRPGPAPIPRSPGARLGLRDRNSGTF